MLGLLEVEPGLLRIAADYGYIRAAEACEGATCAQQDLTRAVVELRRRAWATEKELLASAGSGSDLQELRSVKRQLRDMVVRVPASRVPADAGQWWRRWEGHPTPVPEPGWLDERTSGGPGASVADPA